MPTLHHPARAISLAKTLLCIFLSSGSLPLAAAATPALPSWVAPAASFIDPQRKRRLQQAFPEIDRQFNEFLQREQVPGAAWGVVLDGELVHVGLQGVRDLQSGDPVRRDTVFRIASMTKSFTALAILQLRDAGKLALDDPAERYLPELRRLRYPTGDSPRLTLRHLLTHAAGFPEDNPWGDQQLPISEARLDALLGAGIPFANAPGLAYEYSNYGYALLGRIVARVSGLSYRDYVQRNILQPLRMEATTLEPGEVPPGRLAIGYRREARQWTVEAPLADGAFGAMGGMLTTLDDLARYVGVYLDAWPARDGPERAPLSRASLREMQQLWRARPSRVTGGAAGALRLDVGGYGYGLRVTENCAFGHSVAHGGRLPGYGSLMRWLPEYGIGLIALGNRTYTGWGGVFDEALRALAATGGLAPRVVPPAPALTAAREGVNALLGRWDDALANRLAAMNLFIDRAREQRRAEFAALREAVGACVERPGYLYSENALRGDWLLDCERGVLQASVTLSPTVPPAIQHLEVRALPAGATVAEATGLPPQRCP